MKYTFMSYPYRTYEPRLMEFYGIVNGNGTFNTGGAGVTVVRTGVGLYNLFVNDSNNIIASDLTDTNMAYSANGTGVTKTASCFVTILNTTITATSSPIKSITCSKADIDSTSGALKFAIAISQAPSGGGAYTAVDSPFTFKVVLSSIQDVRF